MDYSAYYPTILYEYICSFIGILGAITFFVCISVMLFKQYLELKSTLQIIGFIIFITLTIVMFNFSLKYFKDIPNILNENYIVTTGTAVGQHTPGQVPETRGFKFRGDDGVVMSIVVTYLPVFQGDRFEVIYLPHTGFGAIIRKIDKESE